MGKALVLDPERSKEPVEYVQALLDARGKYDRLINLAFSNDKHFQHTLNQVCPPAFHIKRLTLSST
jgi:cullin 3